MTSLIQIKRSGNEVRPDKLRIGELAYSYTDSGLKLWIGAGVPAGGLDSDFIADSVQSIGGRFYTKLLDVDSFGVSEGNKFLLLDSTRGANFINLDSAEVNQLRVMSNFVLPKGNVSARPTPFPIGSIRFNTASTVFEDVFS